MLAIFTSADVEPYEELCFSYFGSEVTDLLMLPFGELTNYIGTDD
jgi:hypothetical protein